MDGELGSSSRFASPVDAPVEPRATGKAPPKTMSSVAPGQALSRALPTPAREYVVWKDEDKRKKSAPGTARTTAKIPGYGSRRGFVPRSLGDFGDKATDRDTGERHSASLS